MEEIVISSGGSRGIYALGAAWELQKRGYFDHAKTYSGTSVGAVIAAGLVLNRSPLVMSRKVIRFPLEFDMSIAGHTFGLDPGKGLRTFIRRVLGLRRRMTLAHVYAETGKTLRICVCNLTDGLAEYWTHETHPNVDLVTALRISCSIPIMFTPVRYKGKMYVDGAIVDPLPLVDTSKTLAIGFESPKVRSLETMGDFIGALRAANRPSTRLSCRQYLKLQCTDIDEYQLVLPPAVLKKCFASGKQQASDWIKKNV